MASNKEETLKPSSSSLNHSELPTRNHKSSLYSTLKYIYEVEKDVLRLNVTMNDLFFVNIVQTLTDFSNDWTSISFFHSMCFP